VGLVKDGFLKEYLETDQEELKGEVAPRGPTIHKSPLSVL